MCDDETIELRWGDINFVPLGQRGKAPLSIA